MCRIPASKVSSDAVSVLLPTSSTMLQLQQSQMLLQRAHAAPRSQCCSPRSTQRHAPAAAPRQQSAVCRAVGMVELHQLAVEQAAGISPAALLPGVLGLVAGAAAVKFYCYSQLEVITAKMLSKYVPSGGGAAAAGARVIQLGGGTRELYYYPKDVVLVVNVGEKVNKGLMEQAGVTAAVPTLVKQQPVTDLRFQPDASIDAVVALDTLAGLEPQQQQQCLREVARVLKPGMPLVFVEPLAEGGSPLRGLVGVSSGKTLTTAQLEAWQQLRGFSCVQWDTALGGQDPHAVGVAVRSEAAIVAEDDEGPPSARQQRRRKQPKAAKGFS